MSFHAYMCWFLLVMSTNGNMALIGALDYWRMRSCGHIKGGKFSSKGDPFGLDLEEDGDERR